MLYSGVGIYTCKYRFFAGFLGVIPEYLDLQDPAKSRISGWVSRADFWAQDFFAINKIEILRKIPVVILTQKSKKISQ